MYMFLASAPETRVKAMANKNGWRTDSVFSVYLGAGILFFLGIFQLLLDKSAQSQIWCVTGMCIAFVGHALVEQRKQIQFRTKDR
jgi:hypothetical protein